MIKKIFTLLCLCTLCIGSAWGAPVTQTYTLSDSDNGKSVTTGDITWTIGTSAIASSSSNMKLTGTITVTLPNRAELSKVEITKSNNWGSGATVVFASGTTTLNTFSTSGSFTLTSNKTDLVYTFKKGGDSSKNAWVKEIKVTYEVISSVANPKFSVPAGSYKNAQSVSISCDTEDATIYYTTDGSTPTSSSNEYVGPISISKSTTLKAIAIKGTDKSSVTTAAYKITTYANLEDLIADGKPSTTATPVTVTLTDEVIQDFYIYNNSKSGIYLKAGTQDIVIYCSNVPEDWIVGGKVSGTLSDCNWKSYSSLWELCPSDWNELTYTAPTMYAININEFTPHGIIEANKTESPAGMEVTLTITPEPGYKLASLSVTDASSNPVTVKEDYTFIMPASDVTVTATFVEKENYTITWMVNGKVFDETEVLEGEKLVKPSTNPENIGDFKFKGWYSANYFNETTAPTYIVASEITPSENKTYYAVYAKEVTKDVEKEFSFTIDTGFFNGTSYAANNNQKESTAKATDDSGAQMNVKWTSSDVMLQSGIMQWKSSNGYIYNSTDLGTIKSVSVKSSSGTFTTYYGTSEHPTSGTTVGNGFFTVKVGSETGKTSSIEVTFEKSVSATTISDYTTFVGYTREVTSGNYGTLCLPCAANVEGATIYSVLGVDNLDNPTTLYLKEVETATATAGVPYIFKATATQLVATYEGNAVEAPVGEEDANGLVGSFVKDVVPAGFFNYILKNNQWCYVPDGNTNYVGANKAYFNIAYSTECVNSAKTEMLFDSDVTGIEKIENVTFENGFNVAGMQVGKNFKGIVIVKGKKYLNK